MASEHSEHDPEEVDDVDGEVDPEQAEKLDEIARLLGDEVDPEKQSGPEWARERGEEE